MPFQYRAYGLSIHSEVRLPELVEHASTEPDVRVVLGGVPDALADPRVERATWTAAPGEWLHVVDGVARYYVRCGQEVRIEPHGPDEDVRAFLFASTLGALLHQRCMLVLHASAVHTPAGAVLFAGPSGAGKSTLLAALLGRGYSLLADDKVVVAPGPDGPRVLPGYPTLRLWKDAVHRLGITPERLTPLRAGLDKFVYRLPDLHPAPSPFAHLYLLDQTRTGTVSIEPLDAVQAFSQAHHVIYRRRMVAGFGLESEYFRQVSDAVRQAQVARLLRPRDVDTVEALADAVEADVARTVERVA